MIERENKGWMDKFLGHFPHDISVWMIIELVEIRNEIETVIDVIVYGEFIGKFVPELNGKHIDIVHIVH